jgi:RecB family exonuclease
MINKLLKGGTDETSRPLLADYSYTISPSRLALFTTCRRSFYFKYVLGLEGKGTPSNEQLVGSFFHTAIAAYYLNQDWRLALADDLMNLTSHVYTAPTLSGLEKDEYADRLGVAHYNATRMLELYEPHLPPKGRFEVAVDSTGEPFVEYALVEDIYIQNPLNDAVEVKFTFNGVIDIVLYDNETGEYILIDWKTTSRFMSPVGRERDLQLSLYCYILTELGYPIHRAMYFELHSSYPKEASLTKSGTPSRNKSMRTVYDYWNSTLPVAMQNKYPDYAQYMHPWEDFVRVIEIQFEQRDYRRVARELNIKLHNMSLFLNNLTDNLEETRYHVEGALTHAVCKFCSYVTECGIYSEAEEVDIEVLQWMAISGGKGGLDEAV